MFRPQVSVRQIMDPSELIGNTKRVVKAAIRSSANRLRTAVRGKAPVGKYKGGGRLKRSYRYWIADNQFGLTARVGTNDNKAHLLEYGHKTVNGGFVAARPHLYPALEEMRERIVDEIKDAVRRALP